VSFYEIKMDYKWVALLLPPSAFLWKPGHEYRRGRTPTILQDLHASIVHGIWIITGYTLMMTILQSFSAVWQIYTAESDYITGFALFTIGSLLCALSRTGNN